MDGHVNMYQLFGKLHVWQHLWICGLIWVAPNASLTSASQFRLACHGSKCADQVDFSMILTVLCSCLFGPCADHLLVWIFRVSRNCAIRKGMGSSWWSSWPSLWWFGAQLKWRVDSQIRAVKISWIRGEIISSGHPWQPTKICDVGSVGVIYLERNEIYMCKWTH